MWGDRLDATVYTCANAEIAKEVRKQMKKIDDVDTLLAKINKSSQLNLQVKSAKFAKNDNEIIDKIEWKTGLTKDIPKDNQVVFVDVKQVLPAQPKTLDESKGLVTADYQNALEKEWIQTLRAKYPAVQPGYHMNKQHWNTVVVDGSIAQKEILAMIDHSYNEVVKGLTKKMQQALENL